MISALILILFTQQADSWDVNQNGVWVTDDGKPVVVGNEIDNNVGHVTIDDPVLFTEASSLIPTKGVGFWGSWISGRGLVCDGVTFPVIENTKASDLTGRARLLPTERKKAKLEFYDRQMTLTRTLNLSFVGKSPSINADARYKDQTFTLTTQDSPGRSKRTVKGTLSVLGVTYNLEGQRYWSRVLFSLYNQVTGDAAGYGWTAWWPSKECLAKLQTGAIVPSDRMILGVNLNSRSFPNGTQRVLVISK